MKKENLNSSRVSILSVSKFGDDDVKEVNVFHIDDQQKVFKYAVFSSTVYAKVGYSRQLSKQTVRSTRVVNISCDCVRCSCCYRNDCRFTAATIWPKRSRSTQEIGRAQPHNRWPKQMTRCRSCSCGQAKSTKTI